VSVAAETEILTSLDGTNTFQAVYDAHYLRLVRVLKLDGLSLADSEDVAQEAFARALSRWRFVVRGHNPAGYVYKTAFRLRKRSRSSLEVPESWEPSTPDHAQETIQRLDIQRLLARLSVTQRRCLVLHYLSDLPSVEIAEVLGIDSSTVRVHLHRARNQLASDRA